MSQGPRNRILLVPSSKELGVDVIKRMDTCHLVRCPLES